MRSCSPSCSYEASPKSRSVSSTAEAVGSDCDQNYESDCNSFDYSPRYKRARRSYIEEKVDRISGLPDSVILRIFSWLEAEEVVRTGVLSRRFAYLWRRVDCLTFSHSNIEFIYDTLFFHNLSSLRKFSVLFNYFDREDSNFGVDFDRWIRILSLENVKDLTFKFEDCEYTIPQHFYKNSSIIKLELSSCRINPNGLVNWESLQSLSMSEVDMPNIKITYVVDGCPCLEFLELSDCQGFNRISLINKNLLRKLVIKNYREEGAKLEIHAPHLESIVLSGFMRRFGCKILNAKSLIDCYLDFCVENEDKFKAIATLTSLLEDVSHVKDVITIGEWGLQVLSLIERKGLPFPMYKPTVKCLKLDTNLTAAVLPGIRCLLRGLNSLEKLLITKLENTFSDDDPLWFSSYDLEFHDGKSYLLTASDMNTGSHLKLKTVEISEFPAMQRSAEGNHEVVLLVEFLMRSASLLENVTVRNARGGDWALLQLTKQLLKCPRSSPQAEITIIE